MDRSFRGLKVCRGALEINHLLFVDDSLVFYGAETIFSLKVLDILRRYELASGQCINTSKTMIVFSKNVLNDLRKEIMDL